MSINKLTILSKNNVGLVSNIMKNINRPNPR